MLELEVKCYCHGDCIFHIIIIICTDLTLRVSVWVSQWNDSENHNDNH